MNWFDPRWRAGAEEWIATTLAGLGTPVTGAIEEVRVRPWSVTLRAPTAAGSRWFKANTADCAYEAALVEALARWRPDDVLAPVAVDAARGWLLTADAGPTVREVVTASSRVPTWASMMHSYAVLQRSLTGRADEMVSLGVPDVRVALLPHHLAALRPDIPDGFGEWCAELSADGIPASIQHDDLTDANVFPGFRFFDWGDASVGHPFCSLLAALSSAAWFLGVEAGAPELARLRDAYLEPWSDLATPRDLRRSASLACRVGRVSKALAWQRALRNAAVPVDDDFRTAVEDWLDELPKDPII